MNCLVRYDVGSVIISSQTPIDCWHDIIGVPALADAIFDRVIHIAYQIDFSGDSLCKQRSSS
jgi:DNA replication protein DnaC